MKTKISLASIALVVLGVSVLQYSTTTHYHCTFRDPQDCARIRESTARVDSRAREIELKIGRKLSNEEWFKLYDEMNRLPSSN